MRLLRIAVVACLAAVPVAWAEEREVADDPGVAGSLRLLEGWIQAHMAYRGLPGLSIGIVHDQKLVWSRGFGHADVVSKTPATAETLYRIASNTKTFTATAILQLRDRGKLRLDDPVSNYLPWFKVRSSFPDAPVITIRQLITHTSGLPRESAGPYWIDFEFPTRTQMIAALPSQEAPLAPETRLKYSNLAFALAGEIVASVSAEPYDQYVRKHILEPLGMASTAVTLTPSCAGASRPGTAGGCPTGGGRS